jgi:putative membrane protein
MMFIRRGSLLPRILPQILFTTAIAVIVVIYHGELLHHKITLTAVPFSLVGVALAIFLGFRNSASYDRYWEARKLWGRLLTDARTATRLAVTWTDRETARPFVRGLAACVYATRDQMRRTDRRDEWRHLLPAEVVDPAAPHRFAPIMILLWLAGFVRAWQQQGRLEPLMAVELDRMLTGLNDAIGGCERIAVTPLPFTYSVILHRTVYLYCMLLPFGLLDSIGVMTPVMVAFVAYTFFAIEALGDEIEEPFGLMPNDLALDAMSITIETSLREMLGDTDLPPRPQPVDYILR